MLRTHRPETMCRVRLSAEARSVAWAGRHPGGPQTFLHQRVCVAGQRAAHITRLLCQRQLRVPTPGERMQTQGHAHVVTLKPRKTELRAAGAAALALGNSMRGYRGAGTPG